MTAKQPWILFWGIVVLVLLLAWSYAYPHDIHHPELDTWFSQLHSGKGPCCDGQEALRVDDADWASVTDTAKPDVHYKARVENEWIDIPDAAVVDGPNRAGPTMIWYFYRDGHPVARCFLPGSMT